MFEVQALRPDGWHLVSTPATDADATAEALAEREREHGRTAVRILGPDGNGTRTQLRVWGPAVQTPTATGPTAWLR